MKKRIGIILTIILVISIFLHNYKTYKNNTPLESVIIKENSIKKEKYAMYKENENGEYVEYDSDIFPSEGYSLNLEKSKRIDYEGQIINGVLSYENEKVIVDSNSTSYCYLYFDIAKLYLYKSGDTSGWSGFGGGHPSSNVPVQKSPTLQYATNYMAVSLGGTQYFGGHIKPIKNINYSKFSTLNVDYAASSSIYKAANTIDLDKMTVNNIKYKIGTFCYENVVNRTTMSIDLTQHRDIDYLYIYFQANGNSSVAMHIYNIWLEK